MFGSFKNIIPLAILFFIGVISHLAWFNPNSILISGDWQFWNTVSVGNMFNSFGSWRGNLDLGMPNIQIYLNIWVSVWSLLVHLGFEGYQVVKINLFMPIALIGFFSPYLLINKLIKNRLIAFISAIFYASTTYFLIVQSSALLIAFVNAYFPLILFTFINALSKQKLAYWIIFSVIYSIGIGYELRIMYIVSSILLIYFLYFYVGEYKKYIKFFLTSGAIIFLLSLYWILPTVLGSLTGSVEEIAGRGTFGNSLTNILRSFTLSHWSWTALAPDRNFDPQPILPYFWILPVFLFLVFSVKKNKYLHQMLFFLFITLLGILLVKQSAPPFPWLYAFLRDYFPGFILFRESSKFYLLVSFGYLGLLAYSLKLISEKVNRKLFITICFLLVALFLWNLKPLITKEYRTLFISREIPKEYKLINNYFNSSTKVYRNLFIPTISKWIVFSNAVPRVSMASLMNSSWKKYQLADLNLSTGQLMINFFKKKETNNLLSLSSIKNLVIPLEDASDLENQLFKYYDEPREYYIKELDKLPYLKRVNLGTGDLVVYENEDYKPRVYITNKQESIYKDLGYKDVGFKIINSAEYQVQIKNVKEPFYLNFSENYHPNWKLYFGKFNWLDVLLNKQKAISDKDHFKNDATLNSFLVDPGQVCEIESCETNTDGTYNIIATVYFKPQSYFYLGSIISLSTLVLLLSFLGYRGIRVIVNKQKANNSKQRLTTKNENS